MKKLLIILCLLSVNAWAWECKVMKNGLTICATSDQLCFVYPEQAKSECVKK